MERSRASLEHVSTQHAHCSYCGTAFASAATSAAAFPRTCSSCANVTYVNPIPVGVVLLPVDDGLLGIRRTIEPGKGRLALPGGFLNLGETWLEGAARELREETGITIDPSELALFQVASTPDLSKVILFAESKRVRRSADLPAFADSTNESSERVVLDPGAKLAFGLHDDAARAWFRRKEGRTYQNPQPVGVVLLPVDDGLLAIRRTMRADVRGASAFRRQRRELGASRDERRHRARLPAVHRRRARMVPPPRPRDVSSFLLN